MGQPMNFMGFEYDIREVHMRVWVPDYLYKIFPLLAGMVGVFGCLVGTAATLSLGGVLILYSGSVYCMRWS